MIRLNQITKFFDKNKVLDNVSLDIESGSIFGIIGASGAGKSTLLRCINLLERPDSGQVIVNDMNMTAMNNAALIQSRRNIGMIFQQFNLLSSRTVYENIALPLELIHLDAKKIHEVVTPLIDMTGLKDRIHHYPGQLSGGQKQRVAIARALVSQPKILLCDEVTSALDPNTTQSILGLLREIREQLGLTVVLITHEMDVARAICDKVAVMASGNIVEKNSVEHIFLNPQHTITRQFVHSVTQENKTLDEHQLSLDAESGKYPVIRLAFVGKMAQEPIITKAARQFDVDFSILHGDIETINNKSMGFLMVKMFGSTEKLPGVVDYLRKQNLTVEIVGYE